MRAVFALPPFFRRLLFISSVRAPMSNQFTHKFVRWHPDPSVISGPDRLMGNMNISPAHVNPSHGLEYKYKKKIPLAFANNEIASDLLSMR